MAEADRYIPSAEFLESGQVRFFRTGDGPGAGNGQLSVEISGRRWEGVQLRLAFPLTPTERMVALLAGEDEYLGTIRDYHDLDENSRRVVEEELQEVYVQPELVRIRTLRKRYGMVELEAETDAGPRVIRFRSPREDIRELGPGRYLLTDAAGNRYELPCLDALDSASQKLWHNLV